MAIEKVDAWRTEDGVLHADELSAVETEIARIGKIIQEKHSHNVGEGIMRFKSELNILLHDHIEISQDRAEAESSGRTRQDD